MAVESRQKHGEAGLLKVMIRRQGILDFSCLHQAKGSAIGERPRLVRPPHIKAHRGEEGVVIDRNDFGSSGNFGK
jgi:hypothetical protein